MANLDCTLKRHNGTDFDALLPTTVIEQITMKTAGSVNGAAAGDTLAAILNARILSSEKGAANGVVPLNGSGKINETYLPGSVFGGLRFAEVASDTTEDATSELAGKITTFIGTNGGTARGCFFIVGATYNIVVSTGTTFWINGATFVGDNVQQVAVQHGDWIVCIDDANTNFALVNNDWSVATAAAQGIVRLSDATVYSTLSGNDVITEAVLKAVIDQASFALAGHNHSGTYQPLDTDLTALAGLAVTDGNFIVGNGSTWVAESGATARASLGLTIGTHVQAYDAGLASLAAKTWSAGKELVYMSAADTFQLGTITDFMLSALDNANVAAFKTYMDLESGVDVMGYDAELAAIAALAVTDGNIIVGNGTTWVAESGSTARASLGVSIGSQVQAWDADLDAIAALAKTDGNFIVGNGTTWVAESGATARTSLGVYSTTEVDNLLTNRPEIYYDVSTGAATGDIFIDLD